MGWEKTSYAARCGASGREGTVTISSDDWGRHARLYEGFENIPPDITAVGRKRVDARENSPRCCGSTNIVRGALL